MNAEKLTISLLGPPLITSRGKPILVRRRKVRYLFYYLACQDHPVSRDELCSVFWPNLDDHEARKNLRENLSILQNELGDETIIIKVGEYISLDDNQVFSDVREFERIINFIRKRPEFLAGGTLSDELYLKIQEALNLWKAPGFMVNERSIRSDVFQHWVAEISESIEYWHQVMLEWMADHCISQGNLSEAVIWLSQAEANDPHDTELNLLSLNCLRELRAWSELLIFCDWLERTYQENGESTLPAVLCEAIGKCREAAKNPVKIVPVLWEEPEEKQIHFIGKRQCLKVLNNRLRNGGMVLIRGEVGSGKSRLVREFYNSLEVIPRLLYYRARPGDQVIPYHTLVESFRKIVSEDEWRTLEPIYAKTLFPLFPFIAKIRSDIHSDDLSFAVGLNRLIPEAFYALFTLVTHRRRCILIWDDAHWCDPDSLRVIAFVHERGAPEEIGMAILIGGYEVDAPALEKLFQQYEKNRYADILEIPSLTPEEIGEITFLVNGMHPTEEENRWLTGECGGNTGMLLELLNSLRESGQPLQGFVHGQSYSIRPALTQLIRTYLAGLTETDQETLEIAAVLGEHIQPGILEKVADIAPKDLEGSMQALQEKHLVKVVYSEANQIAEYVFCHRVIQRFVHEQISLQRRRALHLRAVRALVESANDNLEVSQSIAEHYEFAGERRQAFLFWMRTAFQARQANLTERVYLTFGRALQLTQALGEGVTSEEYFRLIVGWAGYAFDLDDVETCAGLYSSCLQEGIAREDLRLVGIAECGLGWVESLRGNDELSLELFDRSLKKLSSPESAQEVVWPLLFRGLVHTRKYEFAAAAEDFEKIDKIIQDLPESAYQEVFLRKATCQIFSYCELGRVEDARRLAAKSIELANLSNHVIVIRQVQATQVVVELISGNFLHAREMVQEMDRHLTGVKVNWWILVYRLSKVRILLEVGEISESWRCLSEIINFCKEEKLYAPSLSYAYFLRGEFYRRMENLKNAQFWLEKSIEMNNNALATLSSQRALSMVYFLNDDRQKSWQTLETLLADIRAKKLTLLEIDTQWLALTCFPDKFESDEAGNEIEKLKQLVVKSGCEYLTPQVLYLQGLWELHSGNILKSTVLFSAVLQMAQAKGNYWVQLLTLHSILSDVRPGSSYVEVRRLFHRLLNQMRVDAAKDEQELLVKQFIRKQEMLIKK